MKKQNGITLIVLVVTIIVLLILVGVSISMVAGDKGIVSKAQLATQETEKGKANEKENIGEIKDFITENTEEDVEDNEENTEESIEENLPEPQVLAELVSKENYGDKTNYFINGINDWRIFYENEDGRIFLIADYLPVEKLEENMEMETAGTYQYFWTTTPTFQEPAYTDLFMATGYTLNSSYINSKCAGTLLNVSKWTSFVDTTLADYAIGSPTIEMWIASWNEKYNDDFTLSNGTRGYVLSGGDLSLGYSEAEEKCESTGYGTVYFPHTHSGDPLSGEEIDYEECRGYWLASPMDGTPSEMSPISYMSIIFGSGSIGSDNPITGNPDEGISTDNPSSATDAAYNSIRPVVCLKEGVKAVKAADGTWNLSM